MMLHQFSRKAVALRYRLGYTCTRAFFSTKKEEPSQKTLGQVFDDIREQIPYKFTKEKEEETKEKESSKEKEESNEKEEPAVSARSRFRGVREALWDKLPQSFGNDDRTWDEAFKGVFGIKVPKKKPVEPKNEWYEAFDKESGNVYYYNDAGTTVWDKPENATIVKSPEHEAEDWAHPQQSPSYLETKIAEKTTEISDLEVQRDAAMAASDMTTFKELNGKVRQLRKEIEKLSKQANTTSLVNVEVEKSPWERFNENLKEAPVIKKIFGLKDKVASSEAAQKARDAAEDAREALETSQNPMVYKMYSAYDSVFAETEMGEAIREFRKLDPHFTLDGFIDEMETEIAPTVLKAFFRGDITTIESFCSEGAGAAVKASIKDRQSQGRKMDESILSIGDIHIAAAKVVDKMGPMIVVQFMVQQINCLYDLKGNVVEGNENDIQGVFYILALTKEYNETTAQVQWKIKEFAIGGTTPYL